jgi:radical SAM protein with 4Fe4S-binding SPASM domain
MNKLTAFEKPPKARAGAAAPHQFRLLGSRVLITDEHGRWALLTRAEHARLLAGLKPSDPLWPVLQRRGFLAEAFDFDAAARRQFERGLLSWKGPGSHVLLLDGAAGPMELDAARSIVEFVFRCPGPQLTLELVFTDAAAVWPVLWFIVQYARRKGEWARRPVFLIARGRTMSPEQADFLRSHGVTRCAILDLEGAPDMGKAPAFRAQRARARLGPGAAEPRAWAKWFEKWGFESVRLEPEASAGKSPAAFVAFYGEFLSWLLEHAEEANLRDEWAMGLLGGRLWNLPGTDVLEQLAYDAAGRVYTSEEAAGGAGELRLGSVGELRYPDIARSAAANAVIAASHPDNQPLCAQCVYRPFCTVAPSVSQKLQGTPWGRTPESPACTVQMGILDHIFGRFVDEKWLLLLNKWHVDMT